MKLPFQKLILALILVVFLPGISLLANNNQRDSLNNNTPVILIGIGLGFNDYGLGIGFEVPIISKLSAYEDLGVGLWGSKVGLGLNYHVQQFQKGSVLSIGYSRASGINDYIIEQTVEPDGVKQKVKLNLKVVNAINVKYTYNFKISKKSKFGISAGYAIPLTVNTYEVVSSGVKLTSDSEKQLNFIQPGGLILGFRIMFGIGSQSL